MPAALAKLPCGIIYTEAFSAWIERLHGDEAWEHPHRVLTLDYVRCASGPQRGRAWWQVLWVPEDCAPEHRCFHFGETLVHIPKPVQMGLRERCLDCEEGRVIVRP